MNKAILVGRLTRDPEVKSTTTGKTVATFTLAIDRRFKNADGQKEADFINVVVWGKTAEVVEKYLLKGHLTSVIGRIQTRTYEGTDGIKRYVTEVVCEELNLMPQGKKDSKNKVHQQDDNFIDEDFHLMADDDDCPF